MIDLGISKIALIGAVALVVIGPEKLPRVARTIGALIGKAQRYVSDVKAEVNRSMALDELKKMKETAEKEGYFDEIKSDYDDMISKVTPSKERDIIKFKAEISELLENEIISRYYYQKGRTVASLKNDPVVQKAIDILTNSKEYNTILKK